MPACSEWKDNCVTHDESGFAGMGRERREGALPSALAVISSVHPFSKDISDYLSVMIPHEIHIPGLPNLLCDSAIITAFESPQLPPAANPRVLMSIKISTRV